ncbi:MAG: fimbria major subunit, partial [Bacteroidales bacterium]
TDAEGYTYYPILVNKDGVAENGKVGDGNVYRNTQYNISLTIKGLGNPTIDDVDKAFLDVKVEVAPWNVVTQNVEW